MTTEEWLEIVDWVSQRFPRGWTPDQAVAFGEDLRSYQAEDVWDAMYRLYDRGLDYPPNGSQLKAETVEVVRGRIERARQEAAGLPDTTDRDMSWEAWRERLGFGGLTVNQAIKRRHSELFPRGCPHYGCDVCGNPEVVDVPATVL